MGASCGTCHGPSFRKRSPTTSTCWHRDQVLNFIEDTICSGINHCKRIHPAKKTIAFIRAVQRPTTASRTSFGGGLPSTAQDWELKVYNVAVTTLRPDMMLLSEASKQVFLLELTIPWVDCIKESNERKRGPTTCRAARQMALMVTKTAEVVSRWLWIRRGESWITPHTSPAPRRRSHTPNPANYMVPTTAADQGPHIIQKETVGGTTYFYTDNTPAPISGMVFPSYHIYPPTAPHVAYMQPKANAPSFFMADELRQELINRHLITMAQIDQSENPGVPAEVDSYHSLFPLEPLPPPNRMQKTSNFSYITSCYKAVNSKDDLPYCLRRIHGFRLVNTKCMMLVDMWKKIQHSNAVTLREVFTTKAFGDHCDVRLIHRCVLTSDLPHTALVFSYDFHAGAETMFSRHFNDPTADSYFTKRKWGQHEPPPPRQHAGLLPESLIWAYIVQLSSALRTIHTAGLACRVMDPSKILITGKTRLRVNCVGVFDVLTFDNSQTNHLALMPQYQQADLISLGKVVLALACNSLAGIQRENLQKAMELVSINYSSDLKNLILYLLTEQSRLRSVNDIMPMIGARFYTQLDASQMRNDVIEEDLAKEVQNGRLFRLLAKLGTINERPEFQKDPTWSETGDRYLLKLFRDHLFHQVTEAGTPWIDLSHIVSCLNKLDAGVLEKISLVSRDEKSVLVVTYSDLKRCFDSTFQELQGAATGPL
ncbi:PAN2-PAN3 deadenylation complex subunit pan3 [Merluccius polli]|uniref:PAN2-PAN3 deadenylation complex subunit PAN3 n=1 Tax=Merluccius polli TaxID=89951 RepID=A0AA47MMG8_MERPO|nr:PAN2-PAN3 deadenylation complex subunit pan3 [Merluccius polli]